MTERVDELVTLGAAICELPAPAVGLSRLGFVPIGRLHAGVPLTIIEVDGCCYVRAGFYPVRQLSYFAWLFGVAVKFFHASASLRWGKFSLVDVQTGFLSVDDSAQR